MASLPPVYLDHYQSERFKKFFNERVYRYETPFVQCDLPLVDFITRCKTELCAKGIFLKGGAAHRILTGSRTQLSDLDLNIEIEEPRDWKLVETKFLNILKGYAGCDCSGEGGRKNRVLVRNGRNLFAIHTLPTLIGENPQEIDIVLHVRSENSCFSSSDALQISLEVFTDLNIGLDQIEIRAVDGYDVGKCLELMQKRQFTVEPIERIDSIVNGLRGYCRILSRGYYPNNFEIENRYWNAFPKEDKDLLTYLAKHYPADLKGQLIYCLNYYGILERHAAEHLNLEAVLFQQICICLGKSAYDYTESERQIFPKYAQCYLYLRAQERKNLRKHGNVFFPVDQNEPNIPSNNHLYIRSPHNYLQTLSLSDLRSHPLFARLEEMFPCAKEGLEKFFSKQLPLEQKDAAPLEMKDLIGKIPIKQIIDLYQKNPDPTCLESIASVSIPVFFKLLSLTPEFDAPFLKPLFEQHPEKALSFLQNLKPSLARKYLCKPFVKPLDVHFKDPLYIDDSTGHLCIEPIQLYVSTQPKKEVIALYHRLKKRMIQDRASVKLLLLFLPFLFPSHIKELDSWIEVLIQAPASSPDVLEAVILFSKHKEALASRPNLKELFQKIAPKIIEVPPIVQDVLRSFSAKKAKEPSPPDEIPSLILSYPREEDLNLEKIQQLRNRCKKMERQEARPDRTDICLLHLHLLTIALIKKEEANIESELDELRHLMEFAFKAKILTPADLLRNKEEKQALSHLTGLVAALANQGARIDTLNSIYELCMKHCEDTLIFLNIQQSVANQAQALLALNALQQKPKINEPIANQVTTLFLLYGRVSSLARNPAPPGSWKPVREKFFKTFLCIKEQAFQRRSSRDEFKLENGDEEKIGPALSGLLEADLRSSDDFFKILYSILEPTQAKVSQT